MFGDVKILCGKYFSNIDLSKSYTGKILKWDDTYVTKSTESYIVSHNWGDIRKLMWNYVGIMRSQKNLNLALQKISIIERGYRLLPAILNKCGFSELRNIVQVARLITESALQKRKSWPALSS